MREEKRDLKKKKIFKDFFGESLTDTFCFVFFLISLLSDEYNLNPGLEWEDEFTGRL